MTDCPAAAVPTAPGLVELTGPARLWAWGRSASTWRWLSLGLVLAFAGVTRLWRIQEVPGNVFYDAAVRSMALSWHNFFFGALEPSGTVSIDKPPIDLWLQVASTHVFGFGLLGLHLPEAFAGVLACGLLFGALRRPFGYPVAVPAALALAVLPVSVLTARSDTMDSVLAALETAALWLSWQALRSGHLRWSVLAAAIMGLAFNVKLTEMLIALPALALLWLWAAAPGARPRVALATGSSFVAVALSWTTIASLTPLHRRPFPIGSSNGSIWHVTLVYNGLSRLSGQGATGTAEGGAGPLRLLSPGPLQYWTLIGVALLAVCLLVLAALAAILARDGLFALRAALARPPGRLALAISVWFFTGLVAFSAMQRLQPRYLEAFAPAVCAVFGLTVGVLWRGGLGRNERVQTKSGQVPFPRGGLGRAQASTPWGRRSALRGVLVCVGVGLLAVSLFKDAYIVNRERTDSLLTDFSTPALSRYLRAHRDGARYEVASANVNDTIGLVARDGLPVLVLNSVDGSLTRTNQLRAYVAGGLVRFYFAASHSCHAGLHCAGNQVWAYAHSAPVAGLPGLRRFTVPVSGPCGSAGAATVARVDESVARRIYAAELRGYEVRADLAHVQGSTELRAALAGSNPAAVYTAVHNIVYTPHWHIVRLRVIQHGQVLADVGGPEVIAPVSGVLRAKGKALASFVMSVQDDLGYTKLVTRFIDAPIELYREGTPVMGTFPAPLAIPHNGQSLTLAGVRYRALLIKTTAFPAGQLDAALLVAAPAPAPTSRSCEAVRIAAWGAIATHVAARFSPLAAHYEDFVHTLQGVSGGRVFVRSGTTRLAGGGPPRLPSQGVVRYRGSRWDVFSWQATARARIYFLTPLRS